MSGSAMKPHLTTSARPARRSKSGRVSSADRSASTPAGGWNEPTRFLPSVVLMPVLPPTAASTMPSSVVGTCTTLDPAQPGRGHEAGQVGDRSPADPDHGVGAREPRLAEDLPAERRDLRVLGLLAVGDLGGDGLVADRGQVLPDRVAGAAQRPRVDDEDTLHAVAEQRRQPVEQPVADDDVVGLLPPRRGRRSARSRPR